MSRSTSNKDCGIWKGDLMAQKKIPDEALLIALHTMGSFLTCDPGPYDTHQAELIELASVQLAEELIRRGYKIRWTEIQLTYGKYKRYWHDVR